MKRYHFCGEHSKRNSAGNKSSAHQDVRDILTGNHVGYVLLTCKPHKKNGKMEVELSYDGDPDLASYLVDGAQNYFENEVLLGSS